MKRNIQRIASLCLIILLLSALATAALAEGKPRLPEHTFWAGERSWGIDLESAPDNTTVLSVKSSNPKVLSVSNGTRMLFIRPLQPGKSNVTVKYRVGKKTGSVSRVYTIKKFPAVFSTLKVDGKAIQPTSLKNIYAVNIGKKTKVTLTFKARQGWKISSADLDIEGSPRADVTSGKSFRIPKGDTGYVVITANNRKTGDAIAFFIKFER